MAGIRRTFLELGLFMALLFAAPLILANDYYVSVLILACLNTIVVVGLNLLLGYAGQVSLGHAAFYGLAAYSSAVATATYGLPMELGRVIALAVVYIIALRIGIPALKLSGHYLAMATLGFGIIVYIFFNETIGLTGGPSGFVGIPRLKFFGMSFSSDLSYYYLVATVLLAVLGLSMNLISSRIGRALRAIHTSEKAAQVVGIDIASFKLLVFVLSALYAGLAGFLYAHYLSFVAPASFTFMFSVQLVTILGGMASLWGSGIGAFVRTSLPEFLRAFHDFEVLINGGILVVCMIFLPGGFAGGIRKLISLATCWRARKAEGGEHA